jgi:hypothetical protein
MPSMHVRIAYTGCLHLQPWYQKLPDLHSYLQPASANTVLFVLNREALLHECRLLQAHDVKQMDRLCNLHHIAMLLMHHVIVAGQLQHKPALLLHDACTMAKIHLAAVATVVHLLRGGACRQTWTLCAWWSYQADPGTI